MYQIMQQIFVFKPEKKRYVLLYILVKSGFVHLSYHINVIRINLIISEFSDKQPQYTYMERSNFVAILMDPFYKSWEGYYTCTVKENTATHKTWTTDPVYLKSPINESNTGK